MEKLYIMLHIGKTIKFHILLNKIKNVIIFQEGVLTQVFNIRSHPHPPETLQICRLCSCWLALNVVRPTLKSVRATCGERAGLSNPKGCSRTPLEDRRSPPKPWPNVEWLKGEWSKGERTNVETERRMTEGRTTEGRNWPNVEWLKVENDPR